MLLNGLELLLNGLEPLIRDGFPKKSSCSFGFCTNEGGDKISYIELEFVTMTLMQSLENSNY